MQSEVDMLRLPSSRLRVSAKAVAVLLVACWLGLAVRVLLEHPNTSYGGRDEIKYVLLGRMMLDSSARPARMPQYPPGWPALLAANFLAGGNISTAHLLNFAFVCCGVVLAYLVWWDRFGCLPAAMAAVMFAAHRTTIGLGDGLCSEPSFFVALAATVLLVERKRHQLDQPRYALLAGFLAVLCRAVRTVGVAVWGGLVLYYLFLPGMRLRRKLLCLVLVSLPVVAFELGLTGTHGRASLLTGGGYVGQLRESLNLEGNSPHSMSVVLSALGNHVASHARNLASEMIPLAPEYWIPSPLWKLAGIAVALLGLWAIVLSVWQRRCATAWIVSSYLLVIFCWYHHALRFFWPVVPLLWLYAASNAASVVRRIPSRAVVPVRCAISVACVVLVVVCCGTQTWRPRLGRENAKRELAAYDAALDYIEKQQRDGVITVASVSHYRVYLLRPEWRVVALPHRDDPRLQAELVEDHEIQWFVERKERADKYFANSVRAGLLVPSHSDGPVVVLRVKSPTQE